MMKYHEQLKHPLWQKKRLEVLHLHDFQCQECGNSEDQLNVHHPFYKRGAMIWDYEADELMCLCTECHKDIHEIDEENKRLISFLPVYMKLEVMGFLKAMNCSVDRTETHVERVGILKYYGIPTGMGFEQAIKAQPDGNAEWIIGKALSNINSLLIGKAEGKKIELVNADHPEAL